MPFLIATDEGEETANGWSFTGTFGGTQTIDGHEVIVVEDATVTALSSEWKFPKFSPFIIASHNEQT
ncbi:hypothetical protein [Halolamina sp. C58]|uniref:hypothetical protein n=1 Tax=Halolamina sp. C58 TaxID=3421640 RepID=UPI003EB927A5